jgi:hypothetical protein
MELWTNNNYQLGLLQYLIIDHSYDLSKLFAMLSSTPQLRHLSYSEWELQFDRLERLVRKIASNLKVIRLTKGNDRTYFNRHRWK